MTLKKIFEPMLEGEYYPGNKKEMEKIIKDSLKKYEELKLSSPFSLIIPFADYKNGYDLYGISYAQLLKEKYDTVIIFAPPEKISFKSVALTNFEAYKTIFGSLEIDKEINNLIIKNDKENIIFNNDYFLNNRYFDIHMPYLKYIFKENTKVVPIIIGETNTKFTLLTSNALLKLYKNDKKILIINTTNLSTGLKKEQALKYDNKFMDTLLVNNPDRLSEQLAMREIIAKGGGGIITTLRVAEKLNYKNIKILKYINSSELNNDIYTTEGYMSAIIW